MNFRMNILTSSLIIVNFFIISISGAVEFYINPQRLTSYKNVRACPRGYELATLNSDDLWKEAVDYTSKVMGFDKRVWVKQALNWKGNGKEQWLIATPTNPLTCKFPPETLDKFCVPNENGKLVVNSVPHRRVPSLCMKMSLKA